MLFREIKMGERILVESRVDQELKDQIQEIPDEIGIDTPSAIRMFFKAVVRQNGIPFGMKLQASPRRAGGTMKTEKVVIE